jgi:hypothetical protein
MEGSANIYFSDYYIKNYQMSREFGTARVGRKRGAYRALVGRPIGKRPLGRPRHRWEEKLK